MRVPISILDRGIYLSKFDAEKLFGNNCDFHREKKIIWSNYFECIETLDIKGEKGFLKNVKIILPYKKYTQVELFGIDEGFVGSDCVLLGNKGSLYLNQGIVVKNPSISMSVAQAEDFGFKNNQLVSVKIKRLGYIFQKVRISVKDYYDFDFHINRDIAEKIGIVDGDWGEIIINNE